MGSHPGGIRSGWSMGVGRNFCADADGSFLEGRSQMEVLEVSHVEVVEVLTKFWKLNGSGWKWVSVGGSRWKWMGVGGAISR